MVSALKECTVWEEAGCQQPLPHYKITKGWVHPTQPGAMLRADKPQAARSDRRSAGQGGGRVPR